MGTVNFYLKKPEPLTKKEIAAGKKESSKKSLIYLQFKYNGQKLVFTFGQSIDPKNWNPAKQRVKSNNQTTEDGKHSLNDLLDKLEKLCLKTYNDELKNGIPTRDTIKRALSNYINQNEEVEDRPTLFKLIDRFISGEIKNKGKDKSSGSLNNYHSVKVHLEGFQKKYNYKVDFDTITLDFFYKYVSYLEKLPQKDKAGKIVKIGLSPNTIAKDIRLLKVFLGEGVDLGYTTNLQFKHKKFSYSEEETDAVYLKERELIDLFNVDLSGKKRLEQVRDLFVFGSFVGLRFSDYSDIKAENIIEDDGDLFIKTITKKTGEQVIIPCNPIVLRIFEKYANNPNRLPKALSNQKFNDYIKEVCKEAKMTEKGRLATDPDKGLWECISSHTARRSFATNLYLSGFPTLEIMKVTGHKTEKAFMKYIRVSKLDAAKRLSQHIKLKWSEKILRVAS